MIKEKSLIKIALGLALILLVIVCLLFFLGGNTIRQTFPSYNVTTCLDKTIGQIEDFRVDDNKDVF